MVSPTFLMPTTVRTARLPLAHRPSITTIRPCHTPTPTRVRVRVVPRATTSLRNNYDTSVTAESTYLISSPDGQTFHERARQLIESKLLPTSTVNTLVEWYTSYRQAVINNQSFPADPAAFTEIMFSTLQELSFRAVHYPIQFEAYHHSLREPFDYYKFGFDFASILLNAKESTVQGQDNLRRAIDFVNRGENVIFMSNHQSEGDPYAIDLLFDWVAHCDRSFCETLVFMAGDRVRDDPVVAPFSAGRNLLTVYSKKHINDVPELRESKTLHNRRAISEAQNLFREGGTALWFAPSGGRDRRNAQSGRVEISSFDDGAVDMMKLTALKSGAKCHFFPMALWTYDMLPPPTNVGGADVGEKRVANHIPMHMHIGEEIDFGKAAPPEITNKLDRRKAQAKYIEDAVKSGYEQIGGYTF